MSGRALRALLGIPGAFALGALAERALLAHAAPHAPSVVATALNQPLVVATAWGRLGIDAVAILVATVVAGALVLLVAIRSGALEGEAREVRPAILLAAGLGLALALAWPLVFSSDVYAYAAYGDLALRGIDPFGAAPAALADPILEAARLQWSGAFPPCVYGPLSLVPALALVGVFGPAAPGAVLFGLRACAALAFLGSIPLAERALATAEDGTRRSPLLAAYACNPAALWAVAEGHNDAFLLLALLGGLAALRSGRSLAGGLLLGLGPLLKAPGLALGAAALFFGTAASWRRTVALRGFAVSAVPASALALVATLPALHALAVGGRY
ncbi:MAG: hypothetical protein ACREM2_12130, partial [Vulcanimicrobiaceae bacterium]